MNKALGFIRTEQERILIERGHKTQRQTVEDSIWYRFAYHCFREDRGDFHVDFEIDIKDGVFALLFTTKTYHARIAVPAKSVPDVITILAAMYPERFSERIMPDEQELLFKINPTNEEDVAINPCIATGDDEHKEFYTVYKKFIFNSLVYICDLNKLIKLNSASLKLLAMGWGEVKKIRRFEVSAFLEKNESALSVSSINKKDASIAVDLFAEINADDYGRIVQPQMITRFDRIELCPTTLDNETCTLSIRYVSGSYTVDLSDLIDAKMNKHRFHYSEKYIVDCNSKDIKTAILSSKGAESDGTLKFSRAALLQFRGSALSTHFSGEEKLVKRVREMLEFKAAGDLGELTKYNGRLRDYQKKGVQWLLFLYDNNFGGLLCDDMGLGKTHQILAFLASVREHRRSKGSILIVCPTTVISHWNKLISQFTPKFKTVTYCDSTRQQLLADTFDILITSYGIFRNDVEHLSKVHFDIAIFDEAHLLKNRETSTFSAAASIRANVKIALTGTPIENSLSDLKSLFDITLPGLLSSDLSDEAILLQAMNSIEENKHAQHLHRLTGPFILRRLKQTVLDELPPKIEDRRICSLSGDQFSLYQSAIESRGRSLIDTLNDSTEPVPYIHIFALLNYLKQICNHPALGSENPATTYESYSSDKWELFKELLDESLGSGQKVVVFSQYLGMIDIMRAYLEKISVGHVILTGASKKRDLLIRKFSEDEQCRVFIGSLKAGGVGIDLIAGSVVIHYDRWWNAAREDQATDRVHRIGQKRGVQVFKLITEGTIEDTIDKIIERKKSLAETALFEDSPDLLKQFSREDLVELLSMRR
jgi:superfamily II DNA or RNA helicase